MRLRLLLPAVALLLSTCQPVYAEDDLSWQWTPAEVGLQAAIIGVNVLDRAQTRHITRNRSKFYERNVFMGPYPSDHTIDKFFLIKGVAVLAVAAAIPQDYRKWWQGFWLLVDVRMVSDNYSAGVKLDF